MQPALIAQNKHRIRRRSFNCRSEAIRHHRDAANLMAIIAGQRQSKISESDPPTNFKDWWDLDIFLKAIKYAMAAAKLLEFVSNFFRIRSNQVSAKLQL